MGYFNRFLLFIYSLAIAAVSLGIVALCLHVLPMNEILNEIKFALSRWETIAAAVFVFFFSVHILGCALSSGSSEGSTHGEMLLLSGVTGAVSVSVEAARSLVEKTALSVSGVRSVKSKVWAKKTQDDMSELDVRLKLAVGQENKATEIADEVRQSIIDNVEKVLGLKTCNIELEISEFVKGAPSKGPRVV